jgi:hypothetical protein
MNGLVVSVLASVEIPLVPGVEERVIRRGRDVVVVRVPEVDEEEKWFLGRVLEDGTSCFERARAGDIRVRRLVGGEDRGRVLVGNGRRRLQPAAPRCSASVR